MKWENLTNWGRISKSSPKFPIAIVFRSKIDLLKEMWREGDGAGRLDAIKQLIARLAILIDLLRHLKLFCIKIVNCSLGVGEV